MSCTPANQQGATRLHQLHFWGALMSSWWSLVSCLTLWRMCAGPRCPSAAEAASSWAGEAAGGGGDHAGVKSRRRLSPNQLGGWTAVQTEPWGRLKPLKSPTLRSHSPALVCWGISCLFFSPLSSSKPFCCPNPPPASCQCIDEITYQSWCRFFKLSLFSATPENNQPLR